MPKEMSIKCAQPVNQVMDNAVFVYPHLPQIGAHCVNAARTWWENSPTYTQARIQKTTYLHTSVCYKLPQLKSLFSSLSTQPITTTTIYK